MRLDHALNDLQTIQASLNRLEEVTCFRWATTGCVGGVAFMAAALQDSFVGNPQAYPGRYTIYWTVVASISAIIMLTEIGYRYVRSSCMRQRQTRQALIDFSPCLLVGAVVTAGLMNVPAMICIAPTFWMCCMCLGILTLRTKLPANATPVALIYLLGAVVNLRLLPTSYALNGWIMGFTFGIGGLAMSWVLYQAEKHRFNGQANQE